MALFALKGIGIGPGDEVIVPDPTMAAGATAVVLAGGTPVFVDIEPRCASISRPRRVSRRTALMFVSLNGRSPADLAAFIDRRHASVAVVEDAAQSLAHFVRAPPWHARRLRLPVVQFPEIVTTGQGGAVVTNDEGLFNRMACSRFRREGGSDH